MRPLCMIAIFAASLAVTPALAQQHGTQIGIGAPGVYSDGNSDSGSGISAINGRSADLLATTPSRIASSRREMNRGRETVWARRPTPMQLRRSAQRAIDRGGLRCTIAELDMVAQLPDGTPLVEVNCAEQGGVVLADSTPVQVTDCFDLVDGRGQLGPCRIPANVALIAAATQSASN